MCSSDIFLALIAILFPPLAVWVKRGLCTADSLINLLLCTLGFLPGLLHAWYIIAKHPDPDSSSDYSRLPDAENARVTYVVVQGPDGRTHRVAPKNGHARPQGYGATAPMEAPIVQQQVNGTWAVAGEGEGVQGQSHGGEGSSGGAVPPTYAEAVRGDHKVQSRD